MRFASSTHIGKIRKLNEDSHFYCIEPPFAVVADGMGGHNAGDVASQLAVECVRKVLQAAKTISPLDLRVAVKNANESIFKRAMQRDSLDGMGTTLVIAAFDEDMVCVANVGDSRGYYFDAQTGRLTRITRDHSLVEEMIARGALDGDQARHYPYRNVITRSVGNTKTVNADLFDLEWKTGDIVLLCTDGLCGYIDDEVIQSVCAAAQSPQEICSLLENEALEAGGRDNVTIIVVQNSTGESVANHE